MTPQGRKIKRHPGVELGNHVIEIRTWNFDYLFGIDKIKLGDLPYWESRSLVIHGSVLRPSLKATEATVRLFPEDSLMEGNLKSTDRAKPVGYISYRGRDYSAGLHMPSDAFGIVLQMFAADKYRFVIMEGEKRGPGEVHVHQFVLAETYSEK